MSGWVGGWMGGCLGEFFLAHGLEWRNGPRKEEREPLGEEAEKEGKPFG